MMADEAYRAVFLRVHPTGKMVLSLTTESDQREADYAQIVAAELGVPALDVKVVPADTDRFGVGHGYNTTPSDGPRVSFQMPTIDGEPPASRYTGTDDGVGVDWICEISEPALMAAWMPGPSV